MSARRHRHGKAGDPGRASAGRRSAESAPDASGVPEQAVFHDPMQDFDLVVSENDAPPQEESLFDADLFARAAAALKADSDEAAWEQAVPAVLEPAVDASASEPRTVERAPRRRGLVARFLDRRAARTAEAAKAKQSAEAAVADEPSVPWSDAVLTALEQAAAAARVEASPEPALEPAATAEVGPTSVAIDEPVRAQAEIQPEIEPLAVTELVVDTAISDVLIEAESEEPVAEDLIGDEAGDTTEDAPDADRRIITRVRRRRSGRAHKSRPGKSESDAVAAPPRASAPEWVAKTRRATSRGLVTAVSVVLVGVVLMGALYGLAVGVNALARWNARRIAAQAGSLADNSDSLLVIGVRDGVAVGFTALKAERANNRVLGIAIPDGAFVEVPGQGFERIGASYLGGPDVSKDAVSNFLGVQFRRYIVVDGDTYQSLLKDQNVAGLMAKTTATDLPKNQRQSLTTYLASVKAKDVWIVPLPVKPVAVGDQRYFEPQRAEVADLLLQWWGVKVSQQKATPRVIVYNGVGTPGLAGLASQQLIRTGFRVVNSGNAENFDYKTTLILLYHGTQADAEAIRGILGVGEIKVQSAPQELTDLIVIIGADYRPPVVDASTVPTEGAQ